MALIDKDLPMYKSRFEIDRKLKQIIYIHSELNKFKNKVFVNNGLDKTTGCYPLEIKLGTFLIYCRSIFQYAFKEIKESNDCVKKKKYDDYVSQNKIIGYFKSLRDNEIHSLSITTHGTINIKSSIKLIKQDTEGKIGETASLNLEPLDDLHKNNISNSTATVMYKIAKRIQVTPELIKDFETRGEQRLIDAAKSGEPIFETQEFNGVADLFVLCDDYLDSIKSFIDYCITEELIT